MEWRKRTFSQFWFLPISGLPRAFPVNFLSKSLQRVYTVVSEAKWAFTSQSLNDWVRTWMLLRERQLKVSTNELSLL